MFLTYDPNKTITKKHAVTRGNVWRSPWSFYACVFRNYFQTRKKKTLNLAPLSSPRLIYQKRPPHWLAAVLAPWVESTGSARPSSLSLPPSSLASFTQGWDGMRGLGGGWAGMKGHLPGRRQTQCRVSAMALWAACQRDWQWLFFLFFFVLPLAPPSSVASAGGGGWGAREP